MNNLKVKKRKGTIVPFDKQKIFEAIRKAAKDVNQKRITNEMNLNDVEAMTNYCIEAISLKYIETIDIELIQDIVEKTLMLHNFCDTAKAYILYRNKHQEQREASERLMNLYDDLLFADSEDMDLKRDNANVDANAPMGTMLKIGAEGSKCYAINYAMPEKFAEAHKKHLIHIHDLDFSMITFNCCQIDLGKLLKGGFSTGHGYLREPNSIRSAASLACIAIQSNQNDMYGGQAINALDFCLAPYVHKSFVKALKKNIKIYSDVLDMTYTYLNDDGSLKNISYQDKDEKQEELARKLSVLFDNMSEGIAYKIYKQSCDDVEEETKQAMEAMIHNFNTLHSRAGAQTPFSSLNYGLDTSPEGRLIIDKTLDAIWDGLGNGETPIFPISVFQIRSGVNFNKEDPNYDLFKKACKVSAKRLFPNFVSLDSSFNSPYYKEGDYNSHIATMGCRTRTMSNVNGPEESGSRGNFAFVTINLPMLALIAKEEKKEEGSDSVIHKFFELYGKYIYMSKDYLEWRYEIIAKKKVYNFPFLMGQHVWMDSENLKPDDEIREVLKHSSISIGFCGLAECLKVLTGYHHGESEEAQELGLKIVKYLREYTDMFTKETHLNWSTFGTPAESTAGTFLRACRKRFGTIPGVTEHEYFSNSSHVPVYYPIKALDKIRIEAPYHTLENAGHIAYIEMDGDPLKNLKAFESIVRAMVKADMGYFSINHPVDRDPICGYTGIIENECPHCHRKEKELVEYSFTTHRVKKGEE